MLCRRLGAMKSVDQFVEGLGRIAEKDFVEPRVEAYLRENPVDPASLAPYLFYEATHYTRNLIHKGDLFELLLICWESGQLSRIHNHAGQHCWMATPIGRLAVQNYEVVRIDQSQGFCELKEANRIEMDPAHPSYVDREMQVHAVLNLPEYGQRAASLHVYSHPYDRCLVYDLAKKSYCEVPLFYDSEHGRPVASPAH
jgi:cysteine dioxygenase